MRSQHLTRPIAGLILAFAFMAVAATASAAEPRWDLPTRLVNEPPGFAQLRAQYAPMTEAQLVAAGFQIDPLYVTAELVGLPAAAGAMGYHAINPALMGAQFPQGIMDPLHPPVVLLGADRRVIGVEWEVALRGAAPQLYGQTANLGPMHPGVDQPHYMLHAYFRPNGQVLFGDFDPAQVAATPGLPNTGAGGGAWRRSPLTTTIALTLACVTLALIAVVRSRGVRPSRRVLDAEGGPMMARILTVDPARVRGARRLLFAVCRRQYGGFIPGVFRVLMPDLAVGAAAGALYSRLHLRSASPLSRVQREMLATVVNGAVGGAP